MAGVEVQTEKVWSFTDDFKLPRTVIVNKLDRERSDFDRSLGSVQKNFGRSAVPVQIPIGSERTFSGVIDLVKMKAYTYTIDGDGKGKEGDIPANLLDDAQKAHEVLVEVIAEGNDALMEQFFDKGTLEMDQLVEGLKQGVRELRIFPVMCASALHNVGSDLILNFIAEYLPAPDEREAMTVTRNGNESTLKVSDAWRSRHSMSSRRQQIRSLGASRSLRFSVESSRTMPRCTTSNTRRPSVSLT